MAAAVCCYCDINNTIIPSSRILHAAQKLFGCIEWNEHQACTCVAATATTTTCVFVQFSFNADRSMHSHTMHT